jgi:DNA-binding NtrC family response regulator
VYTVRDQEVADQPSAKVCMEPNRASLIVLVAEDEALIGMAMEEALRQAGYTVAGVFAASSAAPEWLENGRADAAVLDFWPVRWGMRSAIA